MQTLQSQLQAAQAAITKQQQIIADLSAKTDVQGQLIMQNQLANVAFADQLTALEDKLDILGELAMQQALDSAKGGESDV